VSTDVFAVIIKTPADGCVNHEMMSLAEELEWRLRQVDGVEDIRGLNVRTREIMMGINEGFPKWQAMFRNQDTINYAVNELVTLEYVDVGCSIWPMLVYLADHKAATLTRVVEALEQFNADWGDKPGDAVLCLRRGDHAVYADLPFGTRCHLRGPAPDVDLHPV
jgi:hypothetical protein